MIASDLNTIATYLSRRDIASLEPDQIGGRADILVLLGNSLLPPLAVVADAMRAGVADRLLICGGIGHSTPDLRHNVRARSRFNTIATEGRTEAAISRDILVEGFAMDPGMIWIEEHSTNCGSNAIEARKLLDAHSVSPATMILVQDPTMQRRTHASFVRAWNDVAFPPTFLSYAPFIPTVTEEGGQFAFADAMGGIWAFDRFVSLLVGEIVRLQDNPAGYGPRGQNFIDHVDVPEAVMDAYREVSHYFGYTNREAVS